MDIYFCEYGMIKVKKLNHITKKVGMGKNEEEASNYRNCCVVRCQTTVFLTTLGYAGTIKHKEE